MILRLRDYPDDQNHDRETKPEAKIKTELFRNYQPDISFLPLRQRPRPILLGPDCYSLNRSRTPEFDIPADTYAYDGCIGSILCMSVPTLCMIFQNKTIKFWTRKSVRDERLELG